MFTIFGKILLSVFLSASFRTANIEPNPIDYQYEIGIEAIENNHLYLEWERENGNKYQGIDYLLNKGYINGYIKLKEAKNIDVQSIAFLYPFGYWRTGISFNTIQWNNGTLLWVIKYDIDVLNISYEIGNDRQIISAEIKQKIDFNNNFYLQPKLSYFSQYREYAINDFWQAKIILGYDF